MRIDLPKETQLCWHQPIRRPLQLISFGMASPCISSDSDDSMAVLSRAAGNYNAEASLMPSVARLSSMLPNFPGIGLWSL